jgi:Skp family chaperone for outer membrane proteins
LAPPAPSPSWGAGDFRQTYSVGFVDIGRAMNPLLEAPTFVEEREALRRELEVTERDFQQRLAAFDEQLRSMDQNSPQFRERFEEAQRLYEEYTRWGQNVAIRRRDELDVRHLQAVYRDVVNAVNVVADRMGIDIVMRFIPADREFRSINAEQALTEIRLRAAVRSPEQLDITSEVMEELGLRDQDQ